MTAPAHLVTVAGFPLALDRCYHPETHMWALVSGAGRARVGMDAVGTETSGTLANLSFSPVGTVVVAGRPFGQLEAAKFVGPLVSPVSGCLVAVNEAVLGDPGLAERDPYGAGWLIEASMDDESEGLAGLLADPAELIAWFGARIAAYRAEGVIAQ